MRRMYDQREITDIASKVSTTARLYNHKITVQDETAVFTCSILSRISSKFTIVQFQNSVRDRTLEHFKITTNGVTNEYMIKDAFETNVQGEHYMVVNYYTSYPGNNSVQKMILFTEITDQVTLL